MPAIPDRVGRPRGRPPKGAEPAPLDEIMRAAADAFSAQGYDGVSLRTVNGRIGMSHNHLYQRFGSKASLWRAVIDWAFGPFVTYLESADDPSQDPLERLRALIRRFIEYSATRPYLASLATLEGAAPSERLDYLYDNYVSPVRARFEAILGQLQRAGRIKPFPPEVIFFLMTSGGTAPFGQAGMAARMGADLDPDNPAQVRCYAEQVAEILLTGIAARS
jgi:TetR/AcrR family transcriptional regulator